MRFKLQLCIILLIMFTQGALFYITLDNVQNKDKSISNYNQWDPKKDNTITRASALDTTTEFLGESVYLVCSNGSSYHIQSNYTYTEINNITHTLEWSVDNNNDTWEIYSPLYWNYSSITPNEVLTINDTDYIYNFTATNGDTTYTLSFFSGETYGVDYARQNQYLCINNADYLDYTDYWINLPAPPKFDVLELNETVYFLGNDSFRLEDTDAQTEAIINTPMNLASGSYYFSICYFVDYWTAGSMSFNYYGSDSTWHITNFDITNNRRWKRLFVYADVQQGVNYELAFSSLTGTGVILIDNFQSWQITNTMNNTETIDQYNISSTVITWDLYQNYGVNNYEVSSDIRDRNDNLSFESNNETTNTRGYSSYLYTNTSLDTRELDLQINNTYSQYYNGSTYLFKPQNSYYQPRTINHFDYATDQGDMWDWSEGDLDSFVEVNNPDETIENGYLQLYSESTNTGIRTNELDIDFTYYNILEIRWRKVDQSDEDVFDVILETELNNREWHEYVYEEEDLGFRVNTWDVSSFNADSDGTILRIIINVFDSGDPVNYLFDYIYLYHEDIPRLTDYEREWRLNSQNDSYTYFYEQSSGPHYVNSTLLDDIFRDKHSGFYKLNYTAYLDSNYPTSLLLPSEQFDYDLILEKRDIARENNEFFIYILQTIFLILMICLGSYVFFGVVWKATKK